MQGFADKHRYKNSNKTTKMNLTGIDTGEITHFEEHTISRDTFIWLVSSLCQINRLPFDETLLIQQFVPPYSTTTVQFALQELGFETELTPSSRAVILPILYPVLCC